MNVRARSCSLFSSFKKGKAFSLRCLSPLCSPAVGGGHTHPLQGGMLRCVLGFFAAQRQKEFAPPQLAWGKLTPCELRCSIAAGRLCRNDEWALFPVRSRRGAYAPLAGWDVSKRLDIFAAQKASVIFISRWPLLRAMRPVAEWRYELANRQGAAPGPQAARPVAERR